MAASRKERLNGGGGGRRTTCLATRAWRRTCSSGAGNPSSRENAPRLSHSQAEAAVGPDLARPSWLRHGRTGCAGVVGRGPTRAGPNSDGPLGQTGDETEEEGRSRGGSGGRAATGAGGGPADGPSAMATPTPTVRRPASTPLPRKGPPLATDAATPTGGRRRDGGERPAGEAEPRPPLPPIRGRVALLATATKSARVGRDGGEHNASKAARAANSSSTSSAMSAQRRPRMQSSSPTTCGNRGAPAMAAGDPAGAILRSGITAAPDTSPSRRLSPSGAIPLENSPPARRR
jgi:hypothetical protein